MNNEQHPLDHFTRSTIAQWIAFAWGFFEATVFFIVPDVLLTLIGCRSTHAGLKATGTAILGALLGGVFMYAAGSTSPETSRSLLVHVPAIDPELIARVQSQLSEHGLGAVLVGPMKGIPYKIYAVEWGAHHGNVWLFLLVSIPARGIRFLISVLLANGIARLIEPWTKRRPQIEVGILGTIWIGFYAFYFNRFGW